MRGLAGWPSGGQRGCWCRCDVSQSAQLNTIPSSTKRDLRHPPAAAGAWTAGARCWSACAVPPTCMQVCVAGTTNHGLVVGTTNHGLVVVVGWGDVLHLGQRKPVGAQCAGLLCVHGGGQGKPPLPSTADALENRRLHSLWAAAAPSVGAQRADLDICLGGRQGQLLLPSAMGASRTARYALCSHAPCWHGCQGRGWRWVGGGAQSFLSQAARAEQAAGAGVGRPVHSGQQLQPAGEQSAVCERRSTAESRGSCPCPPPREARSTTCCTPWHCSRSGRLLLACRWLPKASMPGCARGGTCCHRA